MTDKDWEGVPRRGIALSIDRDSTGKVKMAKGGYYRFSLEIIEQGKEHSLLTLKGFRVTKNFEVLIPPQSVQDHNVYNYILASPEYSRQLIEKVKEQVNGQE